MTSARLFLGLSWLATIACSTPSRATDAQTDDPSSPLHGSFSDKLRRYQKGEPFTGPETRAWDDVAWRGDRLHRQLILWTLEPAIAGLTYEVSDLTSGSGTIPAASIRIRSELYAKGDAEPKGCGATGPRPPVVEIADALSTTLATTVGADDPLRLWVTVDIPAATAPGTYAGTIRVGAPGAGARQFSLSVRVVDLVLPPAHDWAFHLDLWQFPDQLRLRYNEMHGDAPIAAFSDEHLALLEPAYRILADAGQKAVTAHVKEGALGGPSMVRWTLGTDGTWSYDFRAFDRYVERLFALGIDTQINAFSLVGWHPDVIPYFDEATASMALLDAPLGSPVWAERWNDFLTHFKAHLQSKGWLDKTVLYMDEVDDARMTKVIQLVHANDPAWKIGLAYFQPLSAETRTAIYDGSAAFELTTASNPISTFYTACLPLVPNDFLSPKNSPAEMTWLAWHAAREGLDGYLRWAFDLWVNADPFDSRQDNNTAGDFSLAYRPLSGAMSSIRLELLRDGIQDFERIRALRGRLDAAQAQQLQATIAAFSVDSGSSADTLVHGAQDQLRELATAVAP